MNGEDIFEAARAANRSAAAPLAVAWDIETAALAGSDEDAARYDLPIACAGTLASEGGALTWQGPLAPDAPDGPFAPAMTRDGVREMLLYLLTARAQGATVVSFNGLGFDFPIAGARGHCHALARDLALGHVDIMFAFHCAFGFPVGLARIAQAMGLGEKEGLSGQYAPCMWTGTGPDETREHLVAEGHAPGTRAAQETVLRYVAGDVALTLAVYHAILAAGGKMAWTTRGGGVAKRTLPLIDAGDERLPRFPTVAECLEMPEPDVSWMSDPWPRAKFAGWLEE